LADDDLVQRLMTPVTRFPFPPVHARRVISLDDAIAGVGALIHDRFS